MTDNYILAGAERQAQLEAAKSAFFAQGKTILVLPSCGDGFPPERQEEIDPSTVLSRRRSKLSPTERSFLRRLADDL